jgi:hypothetical protein
MMAATRQSVLQGTGLLAVYSLGFGIPFIFVSSALPIKTLIRGIYGAICIVLCCGRIEIDAIEPKHFVAIGPLLLSQSSFYACSDSRLHFGLGGFNSVVLDIYWPSGLHEQYKKIPAKRLITLREGSGIISSQGWPVTESTG